MIRRARSLAALLTLTAAIAACGSAPAPAGGATDAGADPTPITVGTSPTLSNASLYQADGGGYFTDRRLTATISPVQSGAAAVPLLLNGQLQFSAADPLAAIVAISKNVPITIVASGNVATGDAATDSTAILVAGDGPVATPADLAGRTVAVNALNGLSQVTAMKSIDAHGGDSAAVRWVEVPLPQMVEAVSRGQVDAAVVNEPFSTTGQEAGLRKVSAPFSEALPGVPQLVYIAAKPWAEQNPAVVQAFAEAITQANGYLAAHPEDVRTIGATSTETPPEALAKIILPTFTDQPLDRGKLVELMDLMVQYRVLPAPIDLDGSITGSAS